MNRHLKKALLPCWWPLAKFAARSYVAGAELTDALSTCHRISRRGLASTLAYWNGVGDQPRMVADAYLAALGLLARESLNCYLSIKATALGLSHALVGEIMERGRQTGIRIHFDSMWPEAVDQTFALIAESRPHASEVGCTLPGRWCRSLRDADLAVELGLNVRVVKGQWSDPEYPDIDFREGFLAVINRLAGRARHVAVATHDPLLAQEALRRLHAADTPCELELLLGLPLEAPARMARAAGVPVRLYVPYGEAWLPYCISQLRENPQILWWIIRDTVFGRSFILDARRV